MISDTHPLLPTTPVTEDEDEDIVFHTFDEVLALTPAFDRAIIDNFLNDPGVSSIFVNIFRGTLCYETASETQRASVHAILSGIVDGDGSFTGSGHKPNLSVHQHTKDLQLAYLFLYWFRIGSVNAYRNNCKSKGKSDDLSMRRWCVHTAKSIWVARKLEPFLILKQRQAREFMKMPRLTRAKSTFAVAVSAAKKHATLPQALEALGVPADAILALEELGQTKYFVDDSGFVKLVRKVCTSYQTIQAAPEDIQIFESYTVASERCKVLPSKVPKTLKGKCFQSAGFVFWMDASSSSDMEAAQQQCAEILSVAQGMNWAEDDMIPDDVVPSREYMAGFFAAEGSVTPRNKTGALMEISQKFRPICDLFARMYGGYVCLNNVESRGMVYKWSVSNIKRAQAIFNEWKPFLVTKLRDFNSALVTVGMEVDDRKKQMYRAREQHLPEAMKTGGRVRKRQVAAETEEEVEKRVKLDV